MTTAAPPARSAAVDAVRGLALLGSAVATALLWLGGRQLGPGYRPLDGSEVDRAVDLVVALLVDNRVLALFALLLGFGLAQRLGPRRPLHDPAGAAGPVDHRWAVARRAAVLVGLGALHAVLVAEADVLATLGVLLLVAVPLVGARRRTQVLLGLLVVPPLLLHGVADGLGGSAGFPDPPADYLLSVVDRTGTWLLALVLLPFTQVGLVVAVLAGVRLSRSGWLTDPRVHRRGLAVLGTAGAVVGLLGAWPYARTVSAGVVPDLASAAGAGALSSLTGPAAAVGSVCLVVLLADLVPPRWTGGAGRLPAALALLGRRSLPVYLVHSGVLALVLAPWAGGLGLRWGSAAVVALAAGVWAVTLAVAVVRSRVGPPGPGSRPEGGGQPTERQGLARSAAT